MISKNFNIANSLEFYYIYVYIYKFFNFIFFRNNFFFKKTFFLNFKIYLLLNFFNINCIRKNNFKKINKYINFNINFKINSFNEFQVSEINSINKISLISKNSFSIFKIFNLFFLFNYSIYNMNFKAHHLYKLFYFFSLKNKISLIDSNKFLNRWKDAYDLLYNVFYYDFNPIIFGSNLFKNEILSLNWNYGIFDINLWKFYFPFFVFKLNKFNKKTDFFFEKLSSLGVNFYLITDCEYHFKNIHYIKKKYFYSIGLVNINMDPWSVTYPIISFFESFLTQLFFFKLLIFIERKANYFKYCNFKIYWFKFMTSKSLKC